MKFSPSILLALAAFSLLAGLPARADNMASIAITPGTGVVTLAPHWGIGGGLAGFHHMAQDLSLGGEANDFYSIKGTTIPMGGDVAAFKLYVPASGAATSHVDLGSKLTPDSYSALTSADPDIGYGSINFYFIHHKGTTDYFADIVPGSGTSSSVTDLKPMSGPGGPATITGVNGYFGLTFAAVNLGYGLNLFYYLRTDAVTGFTKFGILAPALLGTSADQFDLGIAGFRALAFTGTDLGYGNDKMYYLRLDPITGFTILGTLHPGTGRTGDIANLGSVFTTLTYVPGDLGFGSRQFYTTGAVNPTWQSVSFAAIADRRLLDGSFTVHPTASSALPIALTVVSGSAMISAPVGGVFTVTPTAPGLIIVQAAQAGQVSPTAYEANMLRQSFMVFSNTPDFNGDDRADIIWRNTSTGDLGLWLMNGTSFASYVALGSGGPQWRVAATADFNRDGKTDLLWENTTTGDHGLWLMNGTAFSSYVALGNSGVDWRIAAAADFNGDGKTDILWENTSTGDHGFWLMNDTTFGSYATLGNVSLDWRIAATADFDGDGQADILWENTTTGDHGIWLMNGITFASYANLGNSGLQWRVATAADFNGDGQADILWENASTGDHGFWLMNGTNFASYVNLGNSGSQWRIGN